MNNSNQNSNADSDVIELRELLYLDRPRLTSYIAQIYDGLTSRRDIQNVVTQGEVETTKQEELGLVTSLGHSGELKIPALAGVDLSSGVEHTRKITTGGDYLVRFKNSIFGESKIDQDNLFILFEKYINEKNLVGDYEIGNSYSGFVYVNGFLQIEDRKQFNEMISTFDTWSKIGPTPAEIKALKDQIPQINALMKAVKIFKLDNLIAHIVADTFTASAVINPDHLTLSLEQLHTTYAVNVVAVTVLGIPIPNQAPRRKLNVMGNLDLTQFINVLNASTDLNIFPIAIYRTIKAVE